MPHFDTCPCVLDKSEIKLYFSFSKIQFQEQQYVLKPFPVKLFLLPACPFIIIQLNGHHFFVKCWLCFDKSFFGSAWLIHESKWEDNMKQIALELNLKQIQLISLINFIKQNLIASEHFQLSKNKSSWEKNKTFEGKPFTYRINIQQYPHSGYTSSPASVRPNQKRDSS